MRTRPPRPCSRARSETVTRPAGRRRACTPACRGWSGGDGWCGWSAGPTGPRVSGRGEGAVLDWQFGGLKFADRRADLAVGLIASWLPMVCVILLWRLPRSRVRAWTLAGLIPASLLCLLGAAFLGLGQVMLAYTRHSSARMGSSEIVTYFEDAGAMDDGEVMVQQEANLLPGLLWVKPITCAECLRDVKIKVLNRHHVQWDIAADTDPGDPSPSAKRDVVWVF